MQSIVKLLLLMINNLLYVYRWQEHNSSDELMKRFTALFTAITHKLGQTHVKDSFIEAVKENIWASNWTRLIAGLWLIFLALEPSPNEGISARYTGDGAIKSTEGFTAFISTALSFA